MSTAAVEPHPWSRRRWWLTILLVFAAQVGALFAILDRRPIIPPQPRRAPILVLRTEPIESLGVNDPTLFALPHRMGFSGEAWLKPTPLAFPLDDMPEAPRFLSLRTQELGIVIRNFVQRKIPVRFQTLVMPEPEAASPRLPAMGPVSTVSTLRIEGDLKKRRLLTPLVLPASTNADLFTNSVVHVSVDVRGNTFSATLLLPPGRNPSPDDLTALELAKAARFEPAGPIGPGRPAHTAPDLTLGTLIFEWQPLPLIATNAPMISQ